ncbi:MAG: hypothetical protein ACRERS_03735 [Methylococcales bacterium]
MSVRDGDVKVLCDLEAIDDSANLPTDFGGAQGRFGAPNDWFEKLLQILLFEPRVRKELFADTSAVLLDLDSRTAGGSLPALDRTREDAAPIRDGAVPAP